MIPPPEWKPRKAGYDVDNININIPAPICQVVDGKPGLYTQINVQKKSMTVKEYHEMATSPRWWEIILETLVFSCEILNQIRFTDSE